jgi:PAS domain S-box-containing protein
MKDTPIRVLIVDDVPSDSELAERALTMQGLNVVSAKVETKEEFVRSLQEFKPDIILCDYTLPLFNGMEALKLSLQHDPLLPFIIVTGSINESTAVECMKAGSTDYVLKQHLVKLPFAVKEALEKKEAQLAKKNAESELRESEERYRSLFQNNYAVMLLVDPKTAAIVDANYSACKYYGWSLQEIIAKKITDIDTLLPSIIYTKMDLARKEEQNGFFFRHRLASGDVKDVGVTMGPLFLKNRALLYLIIHEIIERKPVDEALMDKGADTYGR